MNEHPHHRNIPKTLMTNQPYYGFESGLILKTLINSGNGALKINDEHSTLENKEHGGNFAQIQQQ